MGVTMSSRGSELDSKLDSKLTDKQQDFLNRYNAGMAELEHFSTGSYIDGCPDCPKYETSKNVYQWDSGTAQVEPFFSWYGCPLCGSILGGNREVAHGFSKETGKIVHMHVCMDCVVMAANGELPSEENL